MSTKPKLLIFDLWGLGDVVLTTTLIRKALPKFEVHLLAKPFAIELLKLTYPEVVVHPFSAPWTAHYGKYHLTRWPWGELFRLLGKLRRQSFAATVSVRPDPRDHFLMWIIGAKQRVGLGTRGSGVFLTSSLREPAGKWHRIEAYRAIGATLGLEMQEAVPFLEATEYRSDRIAKLTANLSSPIVLLHLGVGQAVRLWPTQYFAEIVRQLRSRFQFHLILEPAGQPSAAGLIPLADTVVEQLSITELLHLISVSALLVCNDSGPMHVAVACQRPSVAFFGPGDPRWFRPWGDIHHMVIRDICAYRPCFDFCRYPEPFCLTKMLPNEVWPEIERHLEGISARNLLPVAFREPEVSRVSPDDAR